MNEKITVLMLGCGMSGAINAGTQSIYQIKNYHHEPPNIEIRKPKEFGHYRKFEKRNKRDRFKL